MSEARKVAVIASSWLVALAAGAGAGVFCSGGLGRSQ